MSTLPSKYETKVTLDRQDTLDSHDEWRETTDSVGTAATGSACIKAGLTHTQEASAAAEDCEWDEWDTEENEEKTAVASAGATGKSASIVPMNFQTVDPFGASVDQETGHTVTESDIHIL